MRRRCHLTLQGDVQGVGLRWSCRSRAWWHGLGGWVRNDAQGTVSLEIEGSEQAVNRFIDWLRQNPGYARIDKLTIEEQAPTGAKQFKVII